MTREVGSTPRRSATLLLLRDDPFEVLLVRRVSSGTFPSALVFPGGAIEPDDGDARWFPFIVGAAGLAAEERAARIGAVRETWEETGILLARPRDGRASLLDRAVRGLPLLEALESTDAVVALDELTPFAHWITPEGEPRRFDTRFYAAAAPPGQLGRVDGVETVGMQWSVPSRAVDSESALLFPTISSLRRLAESDDTRSAIHAARERPLIPVTPVVDRSIPGVWTARIPMSAGYAVTEFTVASTSAGPDRRSGSVPIDRPHR